MNRKGNIRRLFLHGERKRILRLLKICFRKADYVIERSGVNGDFFLIDAGHLAASNAGHEYPVIIKKNGVNLQLPQKRTVNGRLRGAYPFILCYYTRHSR